MRFVIVLAVGFVATTVGLEPALRATDHPPTARAALKDASNGSVGSALLRETPNGLLVRLDLRGLPAGTHALHIHETGRCEPPTFDSAGGHFAPAGGRHGFLEPRGPHAGDLPNIHMPSNGQLVIELFVHQMSLSRSQQSLLDADGAALVLHASEDDYRTEPAGNAGTRIACGVITR